MGRDKARLRLGRRTLLGQVRHNARATGLRVRVMRNDMVPRCGPLGGIYTALKTSSQEAVLFLSCDAPFVSAALMRAVCRRLTGKVAAVFVEAEGTAGFPLVLRREGLKTVEKHLRSGTYSLQALSRALKARRMRLPAGRRQELFNVNTPEDWARARRWHKEFSQENRLKMSKHGLSLSQTHVS